MLHGQTDIIFRYIKLRRIHTNYKWKFCSGLNMFTFPMFGTSAELIPRSVYVVYLSCKNTASLNILVCCVIFSKMIRFCSVVLCCVTQCWTCLINITSWNRAVWKKHVNTSRTGDADLRFYITTVKDGWRKSAFLTRACFPCTIHLIMPVSEWFCWRMFTSLWINL